ncbi:ankyrin repeat domain-containing protein [Candidatus Sumerlaeota bacterium]|nr:ankyrin repeat domain-containing protein [Candidatus Sumerlaeota bacterium]
MERIQPEQIKLSRCMALLALAACLCGCAQPNLALLDAARTSNLTGIMRQLERGANVNYRELGSGATALHMTAYGGYNRETDYLIKHGADVNALDTDRWTPLHAAAYQGHEAAVRMLIQAGAVVDARAESGHTPLHLAAQMGHLDVAMLLIGSGANLQAKNSKNCTPLDLARMAGQREMVRLLLKHGARSGAEKQD